MGAGGNKNLLKIIIPVGAVVLAAIVFAVLWFTGVLPFGRNSSGGPSEPSAIRDTDRNRDDDDDDDEVEDQRQPTRAPTSTPGIVGTPDTPSPSGAQEVEGAIPGRGGDVTVSGVTDIDFIPNQSGFWTFRTMYNGECDPYLTIYDHRGNFVAENDDGSGDGNSFIVTQLDAGATYTINAGYYDGSGHYTLHVSPTETIPASGGEIRANGITGFTFTPNTSAVWELVTSNNGGNDPYVTVFDIYGDVHAYDDDSMGDMNAHCTTYLDAGVTYLVNAGNYGGESGNFTLTVSQVRNELPGSGADVRVSGSSAYLFTPNQSGYWELRTSNSGGSDPFLVIYDAYGDYIDDDDDGAGGYDSLMSVYLDAGSTYVVTVGFYDGSSTTLSVYPENGGGTSPQPTTPSQSGGALSSSGGSVQVSGRTEISFTPSRTGLWVIYTSNNGDSDPVLDIADARGNIFDTDDDGGDELNSLLALVLNEGTTYTIIARFYSGGSGSCTVTAKAPAEFYTGGGNAQVNNATGFTFTPNQSGNWELRTSGNGNDDPLMFITDSSGRIIGNDDDSGGSYNALLTINLSAGETYYIFVGFYQTSNGTCTFSITRR